MKTKLYGWYNGDSISSGNVNLTYWNKVVNDYPSVGESKNDPKRYSKEHYVDALKRYISDQLNANPQRKFIIDLPVAEVWWDGTRMAEDGFEEVVPVWKTLEWVEYVVKHMDVYDCIVGWYNADEPEVWGYREIVNGNPISNAPVIPYYLLKQRYDLITTLSSKPVIAVFCDTTLYNSRYASDIRKYGMFFDVFGFDFYPYLLNENKSLSTVKEFINIAFKLDKNIQVLFVGQGSGSPDFNTRTPNLREHEDLYAEFTRWCLPQNRYAYLLWAYDHGTTQARRLGNYVLQSGILSTYEKSETTMLKSFGKKLCKVYKRFLKLVLRR